MGSAIISTNSSRKHICFHYFQLFFVFTLVWIPICMYSFFCTIEYICKSICHCMQICMLKYYYGTDIFLALPNYISYLRLYKKCGLLCILIQKINKCISKKRIIQSSHYWMQVKDKHILYILIHIYIYIYKIKRAD